LIRSFKTARFHRAFFFLCALFVGACAAARVASAQVTPQRPARGEAVNITADQWKAKQGDTIIYEGHVVVDSPSQQLRADRIEYNQVTQDVHATGHVVFDKDTEHLEADDALYNMKSGAGTFHHVHGTVKAKSRPKVQVLVTTEPLTFDADEVERLNERTYKIHKGQFTVCTPDKPTWEFYAPFATVHIDQKVALLNANFRLFRIPLLWLPYSTLPEGKNTRQSGFLIPTIGQSNLKGTILGDAYYWAPKSWFDATAGGEFMSRRGWSQTDEVRATPWDNVNLTATFFGVEDRGLPGANGVLVPQGGNETKVMFDALLPDGWRAVADVDKLSSLTFRLAFSPTFGEAVNAESNSSLFLSNNFHGFSLNFGLLDNKDFLTETPQTAVTIRTAPTVNFSSVDLSFWRNLPVYLGLDASAGGMYRSDPDITTPSIVQRSEFAPRVVVPLHWGPWLGLTTSFTFRTTRYGAQLENGAVVDDSFVRNTGEFTLDVRLPSFERIWNSRGAKWKHVFEPDLVYRYVTGVNDFGRFIRFDDDETLTDTNELEYGVTNRFYRRKSDGTAQQFLTWRVVQKYYFDPTFGGAIVSGQPNVFQALDSISPFAIAMGPLRFSPLVSDLTLTPGGAYDGELRLEYDTQQHRFISTGALFKMHPSQKLTLTLADFDINADPLLQQRSNQVRALFGYGDQTSKGWNFTGGMSYDIQNRFWQNEIIQVGYNGSCCGIQLEYRKIELGSIRNEGQFRVALVIANIGSFGNVRKPDKIF
jgi:LPS-assembly protein